MDSTDTPAKTGHSATLAAQHQRDHAAIQAWTAAHLNGELVETRQARSRADALKVVRHALDLAGL